VANLAGARPKVTVEKLMGRPRAVKQMSPEQAMRQNELAAGFLERIALTPPERMKQLPDAAEGRSTTTVEDLRDEKREVFARAKAGDAPVPMDAAKATLEAFRARMRKLQADIDVRKAKAAEKG
jgi:hypothetical protein